MDRGFRRNTQMGTEWEEEGFVTAEYAKYAKSGMATKRHKKVEELTTDSHG